MLTCPHLIQAQGNLDATLGAAKEKIGSAVGAHQCVYQPC